MNSLITDGQFPLYVCAFFLGLVALLLLAALGLQLRDAWLWSRFVKACGGRNSAMKVLDAAELVLDAATDGLATSGMRGAKRRGWLPDDLQ